VESTGNLVAVIVEFAARMEHRHDHFCGRDTLFMEINRDSTAIIRHRNRLIGMNNDANLGAMTSQGFIN